LLRISKFRIFRSSILFIYFLCRILESERSLHRPPLSPLLPLLSPPRNDAVVVGVEVEEEAHVTREGEVDEREGESEGEREIEGIHSVGSYERVNETSAKTTRWAQGGEKPFILKRHSVVPSPSLPPLSLSPSLPLSPPFTKI